MITNAEMLEKLRQYIAECGNQKVAAHRIGMSRGNLNQVLTGHRIVTPRIARVLGYQRVIMFEKGGDDGNGNL